MAALALAGCAASSARNGARDYLGEHAAAAARVAAATKAVELEVSRLPSSPLRSRLARLARGAGEARGDGAVAGAWSVAGGDEEGTEDEDVARAETEVAEGAKELAGAMALVQAYARAPSAGALRRYESELASGRAQWNEGVTELWYLAHAAHPPIV